MQKPWGRRGPHRLEGRRGHCAWGTVSKGERARRQIGDDAGPMDHCKDFSIYSE